MSETTKYNGAVITFPDKTCEVFQASINGRENDFPSMAETKSWVDSVAKFNPFEAIIEERNDCFVTTVTGVKNNLGKNVFTTKNGAYETLWLHSRENINAIKAFRLLCDRLFEERRVLEGKLLVAHEEAYRKIITLSPDNYEQVLAEHRVTGTKSGEV